MKNTLTAISIVMAAMLAMPALAATTTQPATAAATQPAAPAADAFANGSAAVFRQLAESTDELRKVQQQISEEVLPLSRKLRSLEDELSKVRQEYQQTSRTLDERAFEVKKLGDEIKAGQEEAGYLSTLLGEYGRELEDRLHVAERQLYTAAIRAAKDAAENTTMPKKDVYRAQLALVTTSLGRIADALCGERFDGNAVDEQSSMVKPGTFVMVGPAAIFRSVDGTSVGTVEQRGSSLEPTVVAFSDPADASAAAALIASGAGRFPLDPTLGNASKLAKTEETLAEHIVKGGPVMYPILALAGAALLVALFKWFSFVLLRKASQRRIGELLGALAGGEVSAVREAVERIKGPVGRMLTAGVEHIREPRELIEEVMYETVLATKLKLQRLLPFISIAAASAPLLGLLGTVTGIINTFKLITIYGSGDVKTLSSGISEALITTEFGLIVAIPSLLLHAFLSRKAKSVIDQMEKAAVAFVNQITKTPLGGAERQAA